MKANRNGLVNNFLNILFGEGSVRCEQCIVCASDTNMVKVHLDLDLGWAWHGTAQTKHTEQQNNKTK